MQYRLRTLLIAVTVFGLSLVILLNASARTSKLLHSLTCAALIFSFGFSLLGPHKWRRPATAFLVGAGIFLFHNNIVVKYDEGKPHAR